MKVAACDVCGGFLSPSDKVLVAVLPLLLQNAKDKNTAVKASAEGAIYKLIHGDTHMKVSIVVCIIWSLVMFLLPVLLVYIQST